MASHTFEPIQQRQVRVWDVIVRLFHWSLVASVALAFLTEDARKLHEFFGYTMVGLIGLRLVWGLIGSHHARFASFVPGPRRLVSYLVDMARGRERRYLGHNPAGGAMVIALLAMLGAIGWTGYLMGTDAYFGDERLEDIHELLANILLVMIGLHVGGVILASLRHSENLVLAMITGQKRADDETTKH